MSRSRLVLVLVLVPLLAIAGAAGAIFARAWRASERGFAPARLHPAKPADMPAMREVQLRTSDGITLSAWFLPPRNGATILLLHGNGDGRAGLLPEGRALAASGYGLLLPDLRGHGDSGGEITFGDRERLDIEAALAFLRSEPSVDAQRLGALAFSIATLALPDVARRTPELRAIALLSPFASIEASVAADFGKWGMLSLEGALVPYRRRGIHMDEVRPVDTLPQLQVPVLVITGPPRHMGWTDEELRAALPAGSKVWKVPELHHLDMIKNEPDYAPRLTAYFDARLRPELAPREW